MTPTTTAPAISNSLPVTGTNATVLGGAAIFMIAFGGGLILLSRRPHRGRHAA
ncbi:LPXTG cell wall anchor domain-containing protein [Dactylosporangium sp. NPDC049742]|uniref:LPXTG cell wall anchor domain-containing protein n=1 Tax=Dactylosporangium sp. NPDC049742 TaxID=3154737 RepID=UPI00341C77D9